MKRREFSAAAIVTATASTFVVGRAQAQAPAPAVPQRDKDYLAIGKPAPTETPAGKVEVIEFFWYSCPHCNAFEPTLEPWIKNLPKDVNMRRVPVAFRDSFIPQQRLYYTLEAMGKLDELHVKVFDAIHKERQQLEKEPQITAWAEKQGIDKARFTELYNSFSVTSKAARATQLQNAYGVQGVPSLGVAGRFYTDGGLAGNMNRALQVVEYLVGEVRKGR